nr:MAG TPA_asm: hypothetical protein [Caudoviricetes sp.]
MPTVEKTKTHGRQQERRTRKGFDSPKKCILEVHRRLAKTWAQ